MQDRSRNNNNNNNNSDYMLTNTKQSNKQQTNDFTNLVAQTGQSSIGTLHCWEDMVVPP
jgi:hypothetical protein